MVLIKFKKDGLSGSGKLLKKFNNGYIIDYIGKRIFVAKKDVLSYTNKGPKKQMRFTAEALKK